jgi:hypothetical protein
VVLVLYPQHVIRVTDACAMCVPNNNKSQSCILNNGIINKNYTQRNARCAHTVLKSMLRTVSQKMKNATISPAGYKIELVDVSRGGKKYKNACVCCPKIESAQLFN